MWSLRVWLSWYIGKQAPASPSRAWNWIGRISKRGKKWKGRWGWEMSTSTSYWEKNIKRRGGKLTLKTHDPHQVKGFKEEGYAVARVLLQLFFFCFQSSFVFSYETLIVGVLYLYFLSFLWMFCLFLASSLWLLQSRHSYQSWSQSRVSPSMWW